MGTFLVSGGAGFIGSNVVRHVLSRSRERVVVLDKLTYAGSLESLADVSRDPRFAFVRGDIADRSCLETVFREHRPARIVNFAAETHVDRSIDSPRPFVETNIVGCFELLEAARRFFAGLDEDGKRGFRRIDEMNGLFGVPAG